MLAIRRFNWSSGMWQIPIFIIILIYFPAALVGCYIFRDKYAVEMITILIIFTFAYYLLFPWFRELMAKPIFRDWLGRVSKGISWRSMAFASIALYGAALCVAAITSEHTPLGAALLGGTELDIARARAEFLATRQGFESLLRYIAIILGRSVLPFIVLVLFYKESKWRYSALLALTLSLLIGLEKSATIFAFLPVLLLLGIQKKWWMLFTHALLLVCCIGLSTYLASGSLDDGRGGIFRETSLTDSERGLNKSNWPSFLPGGKRKDWERMNQVVIQFNESSAAGINLLNKIPKLGFMINRATWIPYITAYDWLRFHSQVLNGNLTYGQQIGLLSWVMGKPKLPLEEMVYEFQLGKPEGGAGASNTFFLVDVKLSFGWLGVILYSLLFTFFAAIIFSVGNELVRIGSVVSFYTAALSPLTATILSGGLGFFLFMALFYRTDTDSIDLFGA